MKRFFGADSYSKHKTNFTLLSPLHTHWKRMKKVKRNSNLRKHVQYLNSYFLFSKLPILHLIGLVKYGSGEQRRERCRESNSTLVTANGGSKIQNPTKPSRGIHPIDLKHLKGLFDFQRNIETWRAKHTLLSPLVPNTIQGMTIDRSRV